jgi:hypothetical protein
VEKYKNAWVTHARTHTHTHTHTHTLRILAYRNTIACTDVAPHPPLY